MPADSIDSQVSDSLVYSLEPRSLPRSSRSCTRSTHCLPVRRTFAWMVRFAFAANGLRPSRCETRSEIAAAEEHSAAPAPRVHTSCTGGGSAARRDKAHGTTRAIVAMPIGPGSFRARVVRFCTTAETSASKSWGLRFERPQPSRRSDPRSIIPGAAGSTNAQSVGGPRRRIGIVKIRSITARSGNAVTRIQALLGFVLLAAESRRSLEIPGDPDGPGGNRRPELHLHFRSRVEHQIDRGQCARARPAT